MLDVTSLYNDFRDAYTQIDAIETMHMNEAITNIPDIFFTKWKAVLKEAMKLAEDVNKQTIRT